MLYYVIQSVYKIKHLTKIAEKSPKFTQRVKELEKRSQVVFSLKRLAANLLRTSLKPDAIAGFGKLPRVGVDHQYVSLDLGLKQDICCKCRMKRISSSLAEVL